jgi:AcrR family transcriptional regulator
VAVCPVEPGKNCRGAKTWVGGLSPRSESEASQRIVAAAVELIETTGADITIADLASSLGVMRPTIYRYFPTADAVMKAAALASVDGFLDRLEAHLRGITDPAEAITECVAYTLEAIPRTPHLGLLLGPGHSAEHSQDVTSAQALEFGRSMIRRFDVDWEQYGYDDVWPLSQPDHQDRGLGVARLREAQPRSSRNVRPCLRFRDRRT